MSAQIGVIDDFLPPDVYERLERFIAAEPLVFGARSNFKTDPHGHWNRQFVNVSRHNLADITPALEANATAEPIASVWRRLRDADLTDAALIRCYLNGYTFGTDGYFHTDSDRGDESTVILYVNERWEPDWAGETVFLGADGDIVKSVLPKRNRAVVFPANVPHAGRGVSRKCMILRQTLIFKTRSRRSADFEALSAFLIDIGAAKHEHETGSLHDHLARTFALLEARGCNPAVCFGGGLHAIYGTARFPHRCLTEADRSAVVNRFGPRAEDLAHLFSTLERPKTLEAPLELTADAGLVATRDGGTLRLAREVFDGLRRIECANLLDQRSLSKSKALSAFWNQG